jgi:hypothetical protein
MPDFDCPYCDAPFEVCHDDGHGYDEDRLHEDECGACGKKFVFRTYISIDHFPEKADCLNGAPHQMEAVTYAPKGLYEHWFRCATCGLEDKGKMVPRVLREESDVK